ncbi:hypothetical protein SAMN05421839_13930 [Halolactibacillus halophilus]|uniref:Uncharacterized protein n=1 Tax=Halolactibacillus halophilus TaxID=306540 RepID=A0A1I5S641_9BACI|nr:hypothetical protein [Halolactibacillus halophilus]GEM02767.1 hypothetical protein HHA03_22990 [Halolactibacillus halophilus]SFP66137.1 hypothetical protein SAMN05421839_13930 [Halolactibacillus halophilus]
MNSQQNSFMVSAIHFLAWFSLIGGVILGIANGNVSNDISYDTDFSFFIFITYTSYGVISFILFAALGKAMILLEDIHEFAKKRTEYVKEIRKSYITEKEG